MTSKYLLDLDNDITYISSDLLKQELTVEYLLDYDQDITYVSIDHSKQEKDAIFALLILAGSRINRSQSDFEIGLRKFKKLNSFSRIRKSCLKSLK
jgi:hypothetical protein